MIDVLKFNFTVTYEWLSDNPVTSNSADVLDNWAEM